MASGTGQTGKPKRNFKKEIERGDVTVGAAVTALKEEILVEVRALAGGYKQSVFELIEKGKELVALEEMLLKDAPKSTPIKGQKKSAAGIKARVPDDAEGFEDEDDVTDGDF